MPEFGKSFQSAREARKLTIDQIAQETRISARFLKAIEDEDFKQLPGGLFNRGFVRAFAERVGLDPEESVARYAALAPDAQIPEASVVEPVGVDSGDRHIVPFAIGALVILIVIFYFFFQDRVSETFSGTGALSESTEPGPAPAGPEAVPVNAPATTRGVATTSPLPQSTTAPVAGDPLATGDTPRIERADAATDETPAPTAGPRSALPATVSAADADTETDLNTVRTREIGANGDGPVAGGLLVQLDARSTTWVQIESDGGPSRELTMEPGMTRAFSANRMLDVVIGNAGGVMLHVNGEPMRALGDDGEVVRLNLTPDNYRSVLVPD